MAFELVTELTALGVDKALAEEISKNPSASAAIKEKFEGSLRQSDYDRKMNSGKAEIDAQRKSIEEDKSAFDAQKKLINDQYIAGIKTREQAEAALAVARTKAKSASELYGVDLVKDIFGDELTTTRTTQTTTHEEPKPEVEKQLENFADVLKGNIDLQAEMMDVNRQHMELFPDKPLVMKELIKDALTQRRPIAQVWDDKFGATAKRDEIRADKYRAEGAASEKARAEKEASERAVNPFNPGMPASPLFNAAANKTLVSQKERAQATNQSIMNAVAAFQSGKYRQGPPRADH